MQFLEFGDVSFIARQHLLHPFFQLGDPALELNIATGCDGPSLVLSNYRVSFGQVDLEFVDAIDQDLPGWLLVRHRCCHDVGLCLRRLFDFRLLNLNWLKH